MLVWSYLSKGGLSDARVLSRTDHAEYTVLAFTPAIREANMTLTSVSCQMSLIPGQGLGEEIWGNESRETDFWLWWRKVEFGEDGILESGFGEVAFQRDGILESCDLADVVL